MSVSETDRFVRTAEHLAADLGEGSAILTLDSGVYYGLNSVGSDVWDHLASAASVGEIADDLSEAYGVERVRVLQDVRAFIRHLLDEGLVNRVSVDDP